MKKFDEVNVKVTNNNEVVLIGTLQEWFLAHDGGALEDILCVIEWGLPLALGTETKVINDDFNTGKWIVEIQE